MGWTIKGMHPKPIAVVVHFLTGRLSFVLFWSKYIDRAQTLLIVYPGMATEASVCHVMVSAAAMTFLEVS